MNAYGGAGRRPRSLTRWPIGDPTACPEWGIDLRSVGHVGRLDSLTKRLDSLVGRLDSLCPAQLGPRAYACLTECEAEL